jgi:hypothetical protein
MRRVRHTLIAAFVALAASLGAASCSDDFGTPCDFPVSAEIAQYCGTETDPVGNVSTATCVDTLSPDCSSRLCVRFQGSDAFCSERCSSNGDCPSGASCERPAGHETGVCVPQRLLQ